jgi:hypothetical protein
VLNNPDYAHLVRPVNLEPCFKPGLLGYIEGRPAAPKKRQMNQTNIEWVGKSSKERNQGGCQTLEAGCIKVRVQDGFIKVVLFLSNGI